MSTLSDKIFELRSQNKSYNQISKELNCSKGTITYYLSIDGKEKCNQRTRKRRSLQSPVLKKLIHFNSLSKPIKNNNKSKDLRFLYRKLYTFNGKSANNMITEEQLLNKIGPNPTCYLTGLPIDLNKPHTYEFDHIIPRSRGGDNSIDNLGLCTKQANRAKGGMTKDEFINMCSLVHKFNT